MGVRIDMNSLSLSLDMATTAGRVKRKTNNTRKLRQKAARVVRRSQEVIVRVAKGFGKGPVQVARQLAYISRKGDIEMENERGELVKGKEALKDFAASWGEDFSVTRRRPEQRDTMHMILSMPENTPEVSVLRAGREFCRQQFGKNHEYVFAMHSPTTDKDHDTNNPHIHVLVKMRGYDGTRLNPRKDDLQGWREAFAEALRDQGEDAEATPRTSRGVFIKHENKVLKHFREADASHPERVSRRHAQAVRTVADEYIGVDDPSVAPRRAAVIREVQSREIQSERAKALHASKQLAWLAAADALLEPRQALPETSNVRPDYTAIEAGRVRAIRRVAALHQSDPGAARHTPSAIAIASMRDMPGLAVVQDEGRAQVFLHSNAPDRLGRSSPAHIEMRRPRARALGPAGKLARLSESEELANDPARLAAQIRRFVSELPKIDEMKSRHDLIKAELMARFEPAKGQTPGVAIAVPTIDMAEKDWRIKVPTPDPNDRGPSR